MTHKDQNSPSGFIHPDLLAAQKLAYEPSGFVIDKLAREEESQEYGAFDEIKRPGRFFRLSLILLCRQLLQIQNTRY